jgi:cytochrome P450
MALLQDEIARPGIVPGPRQLVPAATLLSLRRDPLAYLGGLARQYGDIVRFRLGADDAYLINHPDYIRDVLVTNQHCFMKGEGLQRAKRLLGEGLLTSEGEVHRRQRRLAQPAFHRARVSAYGATMTQYAQRLSDRWTPGQTVDMSREMNRLTLAIAGKTLFDADVESEADEIGEALTTTFRLFNAMRLPFFGLLSKLHIGPAKRLEHAKARLDATIYRMIHDRRESGRDHGDLLSMLLLAQDSEGQGGGMTDEQLRDEVMTIFLAGHETTANALTWTWYLLSQHPEVESRFHDEVDTTLNGRLPTADDVSALRYTEMILTEAIRLYPPAWIIGRRCLVDYEIDGYRIPARSLVIMSQYITHRDSRFFPEPDKFDPERWRPEAREARPKFSYFPFGGGLRVCIGEGFAWMEGALVLATLARRWRMRLVPGHPVSRQPLITLRPRHGMQMTLEPRNSL